MSFLVYCLLATWICCSSAQQRSSEGDSCTLKDGGRGICRKLSSCPSVLATIKVEYPVQCGFDRNLPIVCCKDGATAVKPAPFPDTRPVIQLEADSAKKKAEAKCKEYSRSVTYVAGVLPLLPDAMPSTIETPNCDYGELPLIVGGEETKLGEFPHMVALGYQLSRGLTWACGGSLISNQWVMTAAHCIKTQGGPPILARLGEFNLNKDDDGAHPQDITISDTVNHPDYVPSSKYNDIGLVKLSQLVKFNNFIRPACLYPDETFYVNKTLATGWGRIGFGMDQSDVLLKVGLDIINNDQCDRLYHSLKGTMALRQGIAPTMICAGELQGGKDTCQGDSGGPLQIVSQNNKCIYYVIGITSFGKFCAGANAPGVYTRVSQYLPWIVSVVWP